VKPGFLADLVLVNGNPAQDVKLLQDADRFLAIMKDGAFHKAQKTDHSAPTASPQNDPPRRAGGTLNDFLPT
jgi:hypothetical protein